MKWYKRLSWKCWYLQILVKEKKRFWVGGAFWPVVLVEDKKDDLTLGIEEKVTLEHEKIHLKQQLELLLLGWVVLYIYYHLTRGYLYNPLENEAHFYEAYPKDRVPYGWINFI